MDTDPTTENTDSGDDGGGRQEPRHSRFMADTPAFIIYDPLLDPDATTNGGSGTGGGDE